MTINVQMFCKTCVKLSVKRQTGNVNLTSVASLPRPAGVIRAGGRQVSLLTYKKVKYCLHTTG